MKTPEVFSCYLRFWSSFLLLLSTIPRFMSPSDVAAPFVHPGTELWFETRSAPIWRVSAPCAKALRTINGGNRSPKGAYMRLIRITKRWAAGSGSRLLGFQVPIVMPMRYDGARRGDRRRRHVSSTACQCKARLQASQCPTKGENGRALLHFWGRCFQSPPPSLPKPTIYNNASQRPMAFRGPEVVHTFTRIKGAWNS